jgi:mono/diheme cytochrome c family protein
MRVFSSHGAIVAIVAVTLSASSWARSESLVERGSYLVNTVMACGNCHTPRGPDGSLSSGKELSGGISFDVPPFAVTAPNITPDSETGIGSWTDDEIKRALIEGTRPDHGRLPGVPLAAIMPANFYKALTPQDLDAIVAYLRSIPPVRNEVPAPVYKLPAAHLHVPYPNAEKSYTEESLKDPVSRGRYLATIGHCMECHSAAPRGVSDYVNGLGKGGRSFLPSQVKGLPSTWEGSTARNITSDPKFGLGDWSDSEIKRAITQGISRDGHQLKPPMAFAWYAKMSDQDVDALVAWLRTVPPLQ